VLVAHQQHSFTRLDNNLVENAIRPSAIGKKNWLFIYSLVVSCQRHDKDPLAYPRNVCKRRFECLLDEVSAVIAMRGLEIP